MNARELKALERVFSSEIEGRLVLRSNAKIYEQLARDGYVMWVTDTLRGNGSSAIDRIPMKVEGWILTPKGHYAYCSNCESPQA